MRIHPPFHVLQNCFPGIHVCVGSNRRAQASHFHKCGKTVEIEPQLRSKVQSLRFEAEARRRQFTMSATGATGLSGMSLVLFMLASRRELIVTEGAEAASENSRRSECRTPQVMHRISTADFPSALAMMACCKRSLLSALQRHSRSWGPRKCPAVSLPRSSREASAKMNVGASGDSRWGRRSAASRFLAGAIHMQHQIAKREPDILRRWIDADRGDNFMRCDAVA